MAHLLSLFILMLNLLCFSSGSFAQSLCVQIFHESELYRQLQLYPSYLRSPRFTGNPQEILWHLQRQGDNLQAQKLEKELLKSLAKIDGLEELPLHWNLISTEKNLNKVYLGSVDGVKVVVKFSERSFRYEALVSQIARQLSIPVPLTVSVQVGDRPGIAQLYMEGWEPLLDTAKPDLKRNLVLEFFDRLIVNGDINDGNVLVREDSSDQIGIDYEFAFEARDPFDVLETGANPWLLTHLADLAQEFPLAFEKLRDPQVREHVSELVAQSNIEQPQLFADHIRSQLRALENVARLLLSN